MVTSKNIPKKHHFVSACYLKMFTLGKTKSSTIFCFDLTRKKGFTQIPKNIGCEYGFNKLDPEGTALIETELSKFEALAEKAISNIEQNLVFEKNDKAVILNLIALYAIRTPKMRNHWNSIMEDWLKRDLAITAAQPIGTKVSSGLEVTQELKEFVEKIPYRLTFPSSQNMEMEFKLLNDGIIQASLAKRKWMLVKAPDEYHFITSDNPVSLIWKNQNIKMSPGYGCSNTQVIFPLSSKITLVGDFDGKDETHIGTPENIARINTNTRVSADSFIYCPKPNFHFIKRINNQDVVNFFTIKT